MKEVHHGHLIVVTGTVLQEVSAGEFKKRRAQLTSHAGAGQAWEEAILGCPQNMNLGFKSSIISPQRDKVST
jgi:hypothetical protein